ncbi:transcriptional regulator [Taibaiella sp. KBW10]|uniref:Crp/Fnr family transcriptional regulator n=1 Tax=Taibaiella sp. KBW10 TaxID=2153357 RepID=UPI000F5A1F69|nr:Crp/Fnr family transcriptional regulator [Taibaiella sp. KBW10]RQO29877.1 transcriptional regulator [Taibaiella sp. KBW10]
MKHVGLCNTSACLLCAHCVPEWSALTALKKQTLQFKKGATLFEEGDPVTGMYFTLEGALKVHRKWNGKELIMRWVADKDILGIRGFQGKAYTATATALAPTTVCFIPNAHIEASLKANGSFAYSLMQFYAAELQKTEQRMSDFAHMPVKGRIAQALLDFKNRFGVSADGFIRLSVTRQDIAAYAATTYETVFKVFAEWGLLSLIENSGKYIRIKEEKVLAGFVEIG